MKKGIICILVCMLMIATVMLPAQGNLNINISTEKNNKTGDVLLADDVEWWPMFHHDVQITGFTPADSPDTNNLLWDNQIDKDIFFSSPAIFDDNLVIGPDIDTIIDQEKCQSIVISMVQKSS